MTRGLRLALACVAVVVVPGGTAAAATQAHQSAPVGAVYTQTNAVDGNEIVVFDRHADGTIAKRERVSTGGNGSTQFVGCVPPACPIAALDSQNAVVVSKNGQFVFAVNAGSDTVSSFRETRAGLVLVDQEPSGGDLPESLALSGNLLYVLNVDTANANGTTGNIYGLRVAPDGSLSPVGSSQPLAHPAPFFATARQIEFDPTGRVLVVTELAGALLVGGFPGAINTFLVGADGKAGPVQSYPSSSPFPFGFGFDNKGRIIVSELVDPTGATDGAASIYDVSETGVVTHLDTQPSGGVAPCWVVVTNSGRFAYVVNAGGVLPSDAPIAGFAVSPSGTLTPAGAAPSTSGEFARTDAAISRDGKYLYVLSPSMGAPGAAPSHIDMYAIGVDGSLSLIGQTPPGDALGIGVTGLAAS